MPRHADKIIWLDEPEEHDYPAAARFLSLIYEPYQVANCIELLRKAPMTSFQAKDILRAAWLPLLDESNAHVRHNLKKIADGKALSPVLLVRSTQKITADIYVCVTTIADVVCPDCLIAGIDTAHMAGLKTRTYPPAFHRGLSGEMDQYAIEFINRSLPGWADLARRRHDRIWSSAMYPDNSIEERRLRPSSHLTW